MAIETSGSHPSKNVEKFDPFHPDMPQIPGLSGARRRGAHGASINKLKRLAQLAGIALAATVVVVAVVVGGLKALRRIAEFRPADPASTEASDSTPTALDSIPPVLGVAGPTRVATAEELSKPWSAKKFSFTKPLTRETVDAMVIRLPDGGLWAFSLLEPYGQCELEYITNMGQLAERYGYHASHPMVANPCNKTIYDPLKAGSIGGGVWARGDIVQGGGLRPPLAIEVLQKGRFIVASRME
jgi:hypothetical protein